MAEANDYNEIFEQLVDEADDIEGFIAYGLYKQAKREWLIVFQAKHARAPSKADLRAFVANWTPTLLQSLRETAESALSNYAQIVVEEERPTIERNILKQGRPLWKDVLIGVVSAVSYSVILVLAAYILHVFGNDFTDALTSFGK